MTRITLAKWQITSWILVGIPLLLALIALTYQACTPYREAQYQDVKQYEIIDATSNISRTLTMTISYPAVIPLEKPGKAGRPISVWLTELSPSSSSPVSYSVRLEPLTAGVLFTDKDGSPAIPYIALLVESLPTGSGVCFVHRAPLTNTRSIPTTAAIAPHLYTHYGNEVDTSKSVLPLQTHIETRWAAFWRRFWDALFGPTVPLFGLAGTLLGLVWQERLRSRVRQETWEQEHTQRMSGIASLDAIDPDLLPPKDLDLAVQRYVQLWEDVKTSKDTEAAGILDRMLGRWGILVANQMRDAWARGDRLSAQQLARMVQGMAGKVPASTRAGKLSLRGHLLQVLTDYFNEEELRTLCFELDVDYDELGGTHPKAKARELIAYLERHRLLASLLEVGRRQRPEIPWDDTTVERGGIVWPDGSERDEEVKNGSHSE